MSDRRSLAVAFATACLMVSTVSGAGQFGLFKRDSKPEYQRFKDPGGRFTVEFPKDWQVVGGAGDVLVTFVQKKNEAAIAVERFQMNQPLAPADITDLFEQIEEDVLKERQPRATSIAGKLVDAIGLRVVVIDYSRPGVLASEHVRQYSIPVEQQLYRLTCSAQEAQFPRFDPLFAHFLETFKTMAAVKASTGSHGA